MKFFCSLAVMVSAASLSSTALAKGTSANDEASAAITQEIETVKAAFGVLDKGSEGESDGMEGSSSDLAMMHRGPCRRITLDDAQKAALRTALYEHKKARITIKAEIKTAHLTYAHTVSSSESTRAEAEAAGTALTTAIGKSFTSKTEFATKVLYDILTAEQRPAGYKCMKWLARKHRHHHRH